MTLDEYRHLWDGSEPGWTLHRFDRIVWRITFSFAPNGAVQSDIIALRKLLPALRAQPISNVVASLRGQASYELPEELGNIDMRNLMDAANTLGLEPHAESIDRGGYLPVHADGSALLIENDDESKLVAERMLAAGVPVTEIHVD
ncbi:hypothetical protein [Rhodopirellula baltica]